MDYKPPNYSLRHTCLLSRNADQYNNYLSSSDYNPFDDSDYSIYGQTIWRKAQWS